MIRQQQLVDHAYQVLSRAFVPLTDACSPFCIGCACAQAYRELDFSSFASTDMDVRFEVAVCILAAATQIDHETRLPA